MPLGFERINERTQRPNAHINFIRPLPGSTAQTAEAILNRVAAVCYPFMKTHMILVQALEEFPFNREFVGRNFNAGEVIQLVLRDRAGNWLPQRMVEMVMVHELAHCKQMNHSAAFWKVRDAYAGELRGLWARGYTGEGLWGRGRDLDTGVVQQGEGDPRDMPEHVCGGTYGRRSGRKRKRGNVAQTLSYAERKQRRIMKKFGKGGQELGEDRDTKVKLEGGVVKKGKPRVAGSARGRELRAAAALARFDTVKKEEVTVKKEEPSSESETDDDEEVEFVAGGAAIDVDGKEMKDEQGRALVKICEDDNNDDDAKDGHAQREMDELQILHQPAPLSKPKRNPDPKPKSKPSVPASTLKAEAPSEQPAKPPKPLSRKTNSKAASQTTSCPICSLSNLTSSLMCTVCAHVLRPELDAHHWRCSSATCRGSGSEYVNAGDVGRCGVCGSAK